MRTRRPVISVVAGILGWSSLSWGTRGTYSGRSGREWGHQGAPPTPPWIPRTPITSFADVAQLGQGRGPPASKWPGPPAYPSTLGSPSLPQAVRGRTEIGDICLLGPLGSRPRPLAPESFCRHSLQSREEEQPCAPRVSAPSCPPYPHLCLGPVRAGHSSALEGGT